MRTKISLGILISVLAGCAMPLPMPVPAPVQPQAATAAIPTTTAIPAVATGVAAPGKALVAAPAKALITPVKAVAPVPPVAAPQALPAVAKPLTSLDNFDPMAIMSRLPANVPSAPDDPNDDIDDAPGFSAKWLWTWWGISGRELALRTFAKEEGRLIEWFQYPSGWTSMRAALMPTEVLGAIALADSPFYNRTPTSYKFLPDVVQDHSKRHLKIFRRQDVVNLRSNRLGYYLVQRIGSTAIAGYIARAEYNTDRYIAYYDGAGRFLWSYGTNYPAYGSYGSPSPDVSAAPSPSPSPSADTSPAPTSSPSASN